MKNFSTLMTTASKDEIAFIYAPLAKVLQTVVSFFKKIYQLFSM